MDFEKHNIDLTDKDYYSSGKNLSNENDAYFGHNNANLADHLGNNVGYANRNSPLLDFEHDGDYYSGEAYKKQHNKDNKVHSTIREPPHYDSLKHDSKPSKHNENHDISSAGEIIHVDAIKEKLKDLIYWKDIRVTGSVFALFLVILFTLTYFSIISVIAYVGLALLTCSVGYYLYQNLMQTLNKTKQGHVFRDYLDQDMVISPETGSRMSKKVVHQLNYLIKQARHIFLVEDVMDTVKFGFVLWAMTYVGAYFNGLTLFVLMFVSLFTVPKIYSTYRVQINDAANKAKVILDRNKDVAMKTIQDKAQIVKDKVSKMKKH